MRHFDLRGISLHLFRETSLHRKFQRYETSFNWLRLLPCINPNNREPNNQNEGPSLWGSWKVQNRSQNHRGWQQGSHPVWTQDWNDSQCYSLNRIIKKQLVDWRQLNSLEAKRHWEESNQPIDGKSIAMKPFDPFFLNIGQPNLLNFPV